MRLTIKRRHVHLHAQRRDRKGNRNFTIKIIAVALKDFVLPDVYDDIKIALRATANTGLPIARGAQPRTLADSGRNQRGCAAALLSQWGGRYSRWPAGRSLCRHTHQGAQNLSARRR